MSKFLDQTGLSYFWSKIKTVLELKVDKENGKGLSTFDYDGIQKQKVNKVTIDLNSMKGADFAEAGKALKAKVVENGKVTAWEFGDIDTTDKTLSIEDKPADAKAVGDALADKVDAISGKGLSTNDYTTVEKDKLAGIANQATRVLIDNTLSQSGQAADAKTIGDTFTDLERKTSLNTITDTVSDKIVHFQDGADNIPMKDVLVHIEPVQAGSGDPSPTNVRAITGWTAAKVTRCGKNLLPYPYSDTTKEVNGITFTDNGDGTITANGTATASAQFILTRSMPNKDYIGCILNGRQGTVANGSRICAQVYGEPWTMFANDYGSGVTITDSGYERIRFIIQIDSGKTCDNLVYRPMLRAPSDTDATYTPFVERDVYDITFPTEAETVYGGTLDVTNGELVVDRAMVTLDGSSDENWRMSGTGRRFFTDISSIRALIDAPESDRSYSGAITNKYKEITSVQSWNGGTGTIGFAIESKNSSTTPGRLTVRIQEAAESSTTVEDFTATLATEPLQICFPLATPQTYQLTPQEITSLLGTNNLWADTGDSKVEYVVETTGSYVDKISGKISELETITQNNLVAGINAANIYEPTLSSGAINAMLSIAEEYFNYAYTGDHISGLVYSDEKGGEEIQSSAFTPVVEPLQTVDGIDQYTIHCSNFANLMLQAISLKNSRYILGTDGANIHYDWNYPFDDTVITKYVGNVNSDKLYKYAKEHGFGYEISEDHSNVKAGDFIFAVDETSSQYLHITHVAFVLQVGDNRIIIIEGANTTRISREGNEYNVGLRLTSLSNFQAFKYGARFPIRAESNKPNLIEYNNRQQVGTAINSKNIISVKNIKQGFYTIIVDGEFAQPDIKAALRNSNIIQTGTIKTFVKQGNKYILTYYVNEDSDEMLTYAEGAGKYTINTVAVYKGYASIGDFIDNFYDYRVTHILENGTDLNTVLMEGWYSAPLNSDAETILNCPILTGFVMRVVKRGSNYNQIIYYANGLCLRHSTSTGWGSWYKIIGTEVS